MAVMGARPARVSALAARRRQQMVTPMPAAQAEVPARPVAARRSATRRRAETGGISGFLLAIAAAACVALFYLSQSTHVATTGYQIDELEAQLGQVRAEQQQLILQISAARSPAQLESAARALGLRPISEERISFAQAGSASAASVPSD